MFNAFDRRMRTMGGAERVVDIQIGERRERGGKLRIVFLFLCVEPEIFKQNHATARRMDAVDRTLHGVTDALVDEPDRTSEKRREPPRNGLQRELRIFFALR